MQDGGFMLPTAQQGGSVEKLRQRNAGALKTSLRRVKNRGDSSNSHTASPRKMKKMGMSLKHFMNGFRQELTSDDENESADDSEFFASKNGTSNSHQVQSPQKQHAPEEAGDASESGLSYSDLRPRLLVTDHDRTTCVEDSSKIKGGLLQERGNEPSMTSFHMSFVQQNQELGNDQEEFLFGLNTAAANTTATNTTTSEGTLEDSQRSVSEYSADLSDVDCPPPVSRPLRKPSMDLMRGVDFADPNVALDLGYEPAEPTTQQAHKNNQPTALELGYEPAAPTLEDQRYQEKQLLQQCNNYYVDSSTERNHPGSQREQFTSSTIDQEGKGDSAQSISKSSGAGAQRGTEKLPSRLKSQRVLKSAGPPSKRLEGSVRSNRSHSSSRRSRSSRDTTGTSSTRPRSKKTTMNNSSSLSQLHYTKKTSSSTPKPSPSPSLQTTLGNDSNAIASSSSLADTSHTDNTHGTSRTNTSTTTRSKSRSTGAPLSTSRSRLAANNKDSRRRRSKSRGRTKTSTSAADTTTTSRHISDGSDKRRNDNVMTNDTSAQSHASTSRRSRRSQSRSTRHKHGKSMHNESAKDVDISAEMQPQHFSGINDASGHVRRSRTKGTAAMGDASSSKQSHRNRPRRVVTADCSTTTRSTCSNYRRTKSQELPSSARSYRKHTTNASLSKVDQYSSRAANSCQGDNNTATIEPLQLVMDRDQGGLRCEKKQFFAASKDIEWSRTSISHHERFQQQSEVATPWGLPQQQGNGEGSGTSKPKGSKSIRSSPMSAKSGKAKKRLGSSILHESCVF